MRGLAKQFGVTCVSKAGVSVACERFDNGRNGSLAGDTSMTTRIDNIDRRSRDSINTSFQHVVCTENLNPSDAGHQGSNEK